MQSVRTADRAPDVTQNGRSLDEPALTFIYRPFFLSGLAAVLTAGCLLGAVALLGIAANRSYTSEGWLPYILAHANSQLFGWVGFFVMGFALQQHKPSVRWLTLFYRLAYTSLALVAIGIVLRFFAEALIAENPEVWMPVGILSAVSQAIGVTLFITNIVVTRHRTGKGLTWQTLLVFTSLLWFVLVAWVEPIYFPRSHQSGTAGILFVAQYFPPYREAQFLGFVTMMIFGVALAKMHECFGAKEPSRTLGLWGYGLWQAGLLVRMIGWVNQFQDGFEGIWRTLYQASGVALFAGAALLVLATRMFESVQPSFPSQKFIRGAFAWLCVAGALMVLEPFHLRAIGEPFSHAFTGAIRHAVTVGFISQMIVGVGMHVVARMNDLPPERESALWVTFVLLNVGNAARVFFEIVTDYAAAAFLPMGVTGVLELIALAWWGAYLVRVMVPRCAPSFG